MSTNKTEEKEQKVTPEVVTEKQEKPKKQHDVEDILSKFEKLLIIDEEKEKELIRLRKAVSEFKPAEDEEVEIGCSDINGITFGDKRATYRIPIRYGEKIFMKISDLKDILRSDTTKWRKMFEMGVLYFVEERFYAVFKMEKKFSFEAASVAELLNIKKVESLKQRLLDITNSNRDSFIVHPLWFRIADLIDKGEIGDFPYQNREFIEAYFACTLSRAISSLRDYNRVKSR